MLRALRPAEWSRDGGLHGRRAGATMLLLTLMMLTAQSCEGRLTALWLAVLGARPPKPEARNSLAAG